MIDRADRDFSIIHEQNFQTKSASSTLCVLHFNSRKRILHAQRKSCESYTKSVINFACAAIQGCRASSSYLTCDAAVQFLCKWINSAQRDTSHAQFYNADFTWTQVPTKLNFRILSDYFFLYANLMVRFSLSCLAWHEIFWSRFRVMFELRE